LNLGDKSYDSIENVEENFERICKAIGIKKDSLVFSNQVHGTNIRKVVEKDKNKKIEDRKKAEPHDGLMTNIRGISLVTFYADCVPVLFYDHGKKAIAMAHSGWRGTVSEIAAETVKKLAEEYHCDPGNLEVAIGPSIGKCCFEVGEDVYRQFVDRLHWSDAYCIKTGEKKWHSDLQGIVWQSLIDSGVRRENICTANICTKCNKDIFYSHRGDNGKTGSLAAIMQII